MERTLTADLAGRAGRRVRVAGWLHHQRRLARVTFLLVRDAAGIVQVVVEDAGLRARLEGLLTETVVEVTGIVARTEQAPGGLELHAPEVTVVSTPTEALPFELRRPELNAQLPTLLDHAAGSLRHPRRRAVARVAAASVAGFRDTLDAAGFTEIHTPKLVAGATESGANVFSVDYFGRRAYLAQSPQLYKQVMVGALERVYEVGPVFRAEPHDTARHLATYVSLDAELGFVRDHTDVMAVLRDALAGMVAAVAGRAAGAVGLLDLALPAVPERIPSVDFTDAQRLLEAATGEAVVGEPDLAPTHERWIGDWAAREHGSDLVFVTGYPQAKRPFYTHPDPERTGFTNSFDLLFRGVELVTGGQRLHRYEDYATALAGQDTAPLAGYLDAFRYGMPPHGGFAIGLERWVARLTGAANVREVTLFPRDVQRLTP
ncbi:MAG TPA: aspartate--tRNA(Asn) ligase [Acidimicrobiales bacterium]|nr:aspartate--tRNA(Asn) ligase [Acidimicrobiales bacterium]